MLKIWLNFSLISLTAFSLFVGPKEAVGEEVAGYVDWFEGNAKDYEIRRSGSCLDSDSHGDEMKILTPEILTPVCVGDKIIVRGDDDWIRLKLGLVEKIVFRKDSPYPIASAGDNTSVVGKVFGSMWQETQSALNVWKKDEQTVRTIGLAARSGEQRAQGPLDAGLLDHDDLSVIEGQRAFTLVWTGGAAPFEVRVSRVGNSRLSVHAEGLDQRRLPPRPLTLAKGKYRIEIVDAAGDTMSAEFEAVDRSVLPRSTVDTKAIAKFPDAGRTIFATWLAGQDDGRWALESFLQISDLAHSYEPARLLSDALANGEIPEL